MKAFKKFLSYLLIIGAAAAMALSYHLFIFPNDFAPSGIGGVCTIIQELTGLSVGYMSLLINIPLAILVYILVNRTTAVRSSVYSLVFSLGLILLENVDLTRFAYVGESAKVLGPLVGGIVTGTSYSLLMRVGSNTGGMDFIAALIHKKKPDTNFFWIVFALNLCVAGVSYFVYDFQMEPVVLCILYSFTASTVTDRLTKSGQQAIRFEIVTDYPNELYQAIKEHLHHGVTLIPAKGMYRGKEVSVLICVINKSQIAAMQHIIRAFPNTFAVMSQVGAVVGNFRQLDKDGHEEVQFLDSGK